MLITLAIIGVIAAITIPTLITNYQKKQAVTRLHKAYSVISQALVMSEIDNGPMADWSINQPWDGDSEAKYGKAALEFLAPYLHGTKIYYSLYSPKGYVIKNLAGIGPSNPTAYFGYYAITNDGMILRASHVNWVNIVPYFWVDINGFAKPNVYGKDIFAFMIKDKKVLVGYNYAGLTREKIIESYCNKTSGGNNAECATVIMLDNWEMKKDYPW